MQRIENWREGTNAVTGSKIVNSFAMLLHYGIISLFLLIVKLLMKIYVWMNIIQSTVRIIGAISDINVWKNHFNIKLKHNTTFNIKLKHNNKLMSFILCVINAAWLYFIILPISFVIHFWQFADSSFILEYQIAVFRCANFKKGNIKITFVNTHSLRVSNMH